MSAEPDPPIEWRPARTVALRMGPPRTAAGFDESVPAAVSARTGTLGADLHFQAIARPKAIDGASRGGVTMPSLIAR